MYKISDRTYALETGDNIAFVKDGGGQIQFWTGQYEAMQTDSPEDGPSNYGEEEYIVLEVRESLNKGG